MIDFNSKKGFICDMDGVIYHGNQVLPGVVDFINWLHREKKDYLFLTNNSGYTRRELQQKLAEYFAQQNLETMKLVDLPIVAYQEHLTTNSIHVNDID